MASGFRLARFPPRSAGVSWGGDPMPDVEIAGYLFAGCIAYSQLGDFDQTGLDGIDQPEIAHHPRKRPVGGLVMGWDQT